MKKVIITLSIICGSVAASAASYVGATSNAIVNPCSDIVGNDALFCRMSQISSFIPTSAVTAIIASTEATIRNIQDLDRELIIAAKEDAASLLILQSEKTAVLSAAIDNLKQLEELNQLSDTEVSAVIFILEL